MKKLSFIAAAGAVLFMSVLVSSCTKDDLSGVNQPQKGNLKTVSNPDLPIFMGQNTEIGHAEIYLTDGVIFVDVYLDDNITPLEAHLYAGENPPPKPAPGLFPYHWNTGDPLPIQFIIDISDWYDCEEFAWYFALHLALDNGETAWILPAYDGIYWLNKKGKKIGWGQYFLYNLYDEDCGGGGLM